MKRSAIALFLVCSVSAVSAQSPVIVTTEDGARLRGRLLSMTAKTVTLSHDGTVDLVPLDTVTRVYKPADPVHDGFIKGFALGFIPVLLIGGEMRYALRAGVSYGALGVVLDALQHDALVLYDRNANPQAPAPAVRWSLRF